jgi:hypothetical protein
LLDLSSFESPKEGSDFCLTTLPTKALHLTGIYIIHTGRG